MTIKFDIPFKQIKLQDMVDYIEANDNKPATKKWFKSVAYDENGKYQHLIAVRAFCERYCPEIIPVAKEKKVKASDILKDW